MWCPSNEEVGRYALLTDGRRSNRALISFVMRLRFAMTARTRFIAYCTGVDMDARADPSAGRGVQGRRAAMMLVMLAIPCDGQHVVKRFFILPAPALTYGPTH